MFKTRLPPRVVIPVPVVIARLVVVLRPKVPVPVISKMVALPARVTELPLTVKLPPKVVRPVPVVMAWLLVVLSERVPVLSIKSVPVVVI